MENQDNKKEENGEWYEKIESIVGIAAKNVMGGFFDRVKERLHEMMVSVQKNLFGAFLLLLGLVFGLVGIAIFVNDLVRISDGLGYALVGLGAICIGLIIIKK